MTRVLYDVEAVSEAFTSGLFAVVADVITLTGVVRRDAVDRLAPGAHDLLDRPVLSGRPHTSGFAPATRTAAYASGRPPERGPAGVAPGHDRHPAVRARASRVCGFRHANAEYRRALFGSTLTRRRSTPRRRARLDRAGAPPLVRRGEISQEERLCMDDATSAPTGDAPATISPPPYQRRSPSAIEPSPSTERVERPPRRGSSPNRARRYSALACRKPAYS